MPVHKDEPDGPDDGADKAKGTGADRASGKGADRANGKTKSKARGKGKPSGTPRRRKGVKLKPTALTAGELALGELPPALATLAAEIRDDGGAVLAAYREPLGGHALLFAALPLALIDPTPFQRDVSDAHVRRLTHAMDKTRRFLDPIIVVREGERYWTPNGYHRLTAMKELDAKTILALVVPERDVAYQILALNIEKAHNLRERAISVMRMVKDLAPLSDRGEEDYALELEEPALVTLGFAYAERPRLPGGAYHPILRKVDGWIAGPLARAMPERERRAGVVLAFDDAVTEAVGKLKERGLTSPYLRTFVVARVNPLRFIKGALPSLDDLFAGMTKRARGLKVDQIRSDDVARSGGGPPEAE